MKTKHHKQDIKGVIFSSGGRSKAHVNQLMEVLNEFFPDGTPWESWESWFRPEEDHFPIINDFLKRLLIIDSTMLLLTGDDLSTVKSSEYLEPRDNVTFEVEHTNIDKNGEEINSSARIY